MDKDKRETLGIIAIVLAVLVVVVSALYFIATDLKSFDDDLTTALPNNLHLKEDEISIFPNSKDGYESREVMIVSNKSKPWNEHKEWADVYYNDSTYVLVFSEDSELAQYFEDCVCTDSKITCYLER